MAVLFIITIAGYVATKLNILDETAEKKLTSLVFYITLPSLMIGSVSKMEGNITLTSILIAFALGALMFFLLLGCGWLLARICRVPEDERPPYVFMAILTNVNFIGLPVITSIFGTDSVLYTSVLIMMMMLLSNSVGFPMLMKPEERHSAKNVVKASLNPPTIGSIIALVLFFSGLKLPEFATTTLTMLGNVTAPVAMITVGITLAQAPLKNIFTIPRLYPYILVRMVAMPIAAYFVLSMFISDPLLLGSFTVLAAMPIGAMAPAFVSMYGWDPKPVAAGTMLTTLASFLVIPLIMWVITTF